MGPNEYDSAGPHVEFLYACKEAVMPYLKNARPVDRPDISKMGTLTKNAIRQHLKSMESNPLEKI